jgi:hypothetical protein
MEHVEAVGDGSRKWGNTKKGAKAELWLGAG